MIKIQFRDSRRKQGYRRYLHIDWQGGEVYVSNTHHDIHGTPWQIWAGYVDRYEIHPDTPNDGIRAIVKTVKDDILTACRGWDREVKNSNIVGTFVGSDANNAYDRIRRAFEDAYEQAVANR